MGAIEYSVQWGLCVFWRTVNTACLVFEWCLDASVWHWFGWFAIWSVCVCVFVHCSCDGWLVAWIMCRCGLFGVLAQCLWSWSSVRKECVGWISLALGNSLFGKSVVRLFWCLKHVQMVLVWCLGTLQVYVGGGGCFGVRLLYVVVFGLVFGYCVWHCVGVWAV